MSVQIDDEETVRLIRALAELEGVSSTEAVIVAVREAIERRRRNETPEQTAARLRAELGVELTAQSRKPLPRSVFDEMSGEGDSGKSR